VVEASQLKLEAESDPGNDDKQEGVKPELKEEELLQEISSQPLPPRLQSPSPLPSPPPLAFKVIPPREIDGYLDSKKVFGFDIEWRPSFQAGSKQNKVAVVQLCHHGDCHVLHISRAGGIPTSLVRFLENPDYIKVGVNVNGDVLKLKRDFNVETNGFMDLVKFAGWKLNEVVPGSLSGLAFRILVRDLAKPRKVVMSDWERVLSPSQLMYAANDASVGFEIFRTLNISPASVGKPTPTPTPEKKEILVCSFASSYPSLIRANARYRSPPTKSPAKSPVPPDTATTQDTATTPESKEFPVPTLIDENGQVVDKIAPTVAYTYSLISEGKSLKEVAEVRGLKSSTIESYCISAVYLGLKLDLEGLGVGGDLIREVGLVAARVGYVDKPAVVIKPLLSTDVSYFQIRLALARSSWLRRGSSPTSPPKQETESPQPTQELQNTQEPQDTQEPTTPPPPQAQEEK